MTSKKLRSWKTMFNRWKMPIILFWRYDASSRRHRNQDSISRARDVGRWLWKKRLFHGSKGKKSDGSSNSEKCGSLREKLSSLIGDYFSQEKLQQKKNAPENEEKVYMSSEDGFSSPLKVGGILRNTFIRRRTHSMENLLLTDWVCRLPIRNFHGLKAMLLFLRVLMETSLTAKHPCFFPSWRKRRDTRFLSTWRLMILREKISRLISAKKVSVCQMGRLCKQYIILSKPIFLWNIPRNGSNLEIM